MKLCTKCGAQKPLSDFGSDSPERDGLQLRCKTCVNAQNKDWRERNMAQALSTEANYRERNRETLRIRNIAWWRANVQKPKRERKPPATGEERYAAHRENELARCAAYRAANQEKRKEVGRRYYANNKDKSALAAKAWREKNPDSSMAIVARRRAAKLKATPAWANDFYMKEAYRLAVLRTKMFGFKWDVDHRVPLQSNVVCGLHCEENLQVIPRSANVKKGNRVWQGMP